MPVIKEKPNLEFVPALIAALQVEAIPAFVLAADCLQNDRLIFITVAGLVGENVYLHLFLRIAKEAGNSPGPLFMPESLIRCKPIVYDTEPGGPTLFDHIAALP